MFDQKSRRLAIAVALAAVVILVAGGVATASNMGFKINKGLFMAGGGLNNAPNTGTNWVSIPYNNPYGTLAGFCTGTSLSGTNTVLTLIDPAPGGAATTTNCTAPLAVALVPGRGIRVRPVAGFPAGSGVCVGGTTPGAVCTLTADCGSIAGNLGGCQISTIIVGSHNPTTQVSLYPIGPNLQGKVAFGFPYHSTAVNMNDICVQAGMPVNQGIIERLNSQTGGFTTVACGPNAQAQNLFLGEYVRITDPTAPSNGSKTFIPAHF